MTESQQRYLKEQTLIYETITALSAGLDMDSVLQLMSQKLAEAAKAGACVISSIDEKTQTITPLVEYLASDPDGLIHTWRVLNIPLDLAKDTIGQRVLKAARPIVGRANSKSETNNFTWQQAEPEVDNLQPGWRTVLAVPLETQNRISGLVEIYDKYPDRIFSSDDIRICRILAAQTALAIEQARLFDQMIRRLSEVSMLYTMAEKISSSLDLEDVLNTIVTSLRKVIGCRACCIFLLDETHHYLEIKAADGLKPHWRQMAKLQVGEGAAGRAVAERRTVYLPDTHQDSSFIFFDTDVRSLMVVPLLAQAKVIGAINVDDDQPNAFDQNQERLLTIAAAQAGVMIENARLFTKISAEQQQMQAIIHHMADGVLLIDHQGVIITCNTTLAMMLGLNTGEIINKHIDDADLHPNLANITAATTYRARTGVLAKEVTIETPRSRTLQIFSTIMVDHQKNPIGEVRIVHDVTKERELEHMKDDFFSTISHELRTPLFSIQGFAQLMLEEETLDRQTQQEFLTTIQRQALQLSEMVDNLLDVSKFDAGKLEFEKRPLAIVALIQQTILKLQGFAHQQGIQLAPNLPDSLPEIQGDSQRLEQVLTNLIGNAIKFSPAGKTVDISACQQDNYILIQVKDYGIGIPEVDLEQIFSRYYQANNKVEHTAKGSGLGLYIAKKVIEGHNGRIWAESQVGQGSTFNVTLPFSNG